MEEWVEMVGVVQREEEDETLKEDDDEVLVAGEEFAGCLLAMVQQVP